MAACSALGHDAWIGWGGPKMGWPGRLPALPCCSSPQHVAVGRCLPPWIQVGLSVLACPCLLAQSNHSSALEPASCRRLSRRASHWWPLRGWHFPANAPAGEVCSACARGAGDGCPLASLFCDCGVLTPAARGVVPGSSPAGRRVGPGAAPLQLVGEGGGSSILPG